MPSDELMYMNWQELVMPEKVQVNSNPSYGKFVCEPLERGFGITIGNSLRRIVLSSLYGAAIVSVKFDAVMHEFSVIPGIFEDVSEEGDEFFYAYPWQGNFEFQWYRNGEPYDNPSEIPPVLWKDGLPGGTYTVEITNTQPCVSVSEPVVWGLSIGENELSNLTIYPNPTTGSINIEGLNPEVSSTIAIYNSVGMLMISQEVNSEIERMDMADLPNGLYIIQVQNKDGLVSSYKINKL